jgi:hypothetical protein
MFPHDFRTEKIASDNHEMTVQQFNNRTLLLIPELLYIEKSPTGLRDLST